MAMGGSYAQVREDFIDWFRRCPLLPAELEAVALVALMMNSDRVSGAQRP